MSQRNQTGFRMFGWFVAAMLSCSLGAAQNSAPPSIAEQLSAQYKAARMTQDSNGNPMPAEGTVLTIQKTGVVGVLLANPLNPCASTYADGRLKGPSVFCQTGVGLAGGIGHGSIKNAAPPENLVVGQKVYPASIGVDTKRDTVKFMVVSCGACNGSDPAAYYKAEVDFRFPKGLLATGDVSQVEDTIGQVFSIDSSNDAPQGQGAQGAPAQAENQSPSPDPLSVQQGQTIAQVEQVLGKPVKVVTMATKVIYVYHDLKITFTNGKVTDVQ
jgi:hypothetical protein